MMTTLSFLDFVKFISVPDKCFIKYQTLYYDRKVKKKLKIEKNPGPHGLVQRIYPFEHSVPKQPV